VICVIARLVAFHARNAVGIVMTTFGHGRQV
jgi:hypothetical protein